jgi:hypothetical protein
MQLLRKSGTTPLTPRECKLLRFFLDNPTRVITLNELLAKVGMIRFVLHCMRLGFTSPTCGKNWRTILPVRHI